VVTGVSLSIGLVVFAGSLRQSLDATIHAKATLGPGATQVFRLVSPAPIPDDFSGRDASTEVSRQAEASVVIRGHPRSDVLGIDPATFEQAAFWDSSLSGRSLSSLIGALDDPVGDDEVAAIAVGKGFPDRFDLMLPSDRGQTSVTVRVVGRATAFPGYGFQSDRPLVVLTHEALAAHDVSESPEIWFDGSDRGAGDELVAEGVPVESATYSADLRLGTLQPQLWALSYIQVVGLLAGAIPLCALGLYFGAVSDRRRVGAALLRRFGLTRWRSLGATTVEVGALLVSGLAFGAVASWIAMRLVGDSLDPTPTLAPPPLVRFDAGALLICLLGVVVVGVVTTVLVERDSTRRPLAEVLRHAE
jgi:hypothetical protein